MVEDKSILQWSTRRLEDQGRRNVHEKDRDQSLENILGKIIKEYDIRGFDGAGVEKNEDGTDKFPMQMDRELLIWIGRAMGTAEFHSKAHDRAVGLNPGDTFVIAGDNGPSTQEVKDSLIQGLRETGVNVIDLGVTVSGHLYSSISRLNAQGGLYVSRSHVELEQTALNRISAGLLFMETCCRQSKRKFFQLNRKAERRRGSIASEETEKIIKDVSGGAYEEISGIKGVAGQSADAGCCES